MLDTSSVDALTAHVRTFMDAHRHDGGSDIVIDLHEVPEKHPAAQRPEAV